MIMKRLARRCARSHIRLRGLMPPRILGRFTADHVIVWAYPSSRESGFTIAAAAAAQ